MYKLYLFVAFCALLLTTSAYAGDGYQGRPSVCANITDPVRSERCHYWVERVRVPGTESRCCGQSDAYIVDWEIVDGELWMIIAADYPPPTGYTDEEGNPVTLPPDTWWARRGARFKIPPEKMVTRMEDANQSSQSVMFASSTGIVYCAILGPVF